LGAGRRGKGEEEELKLLRGTGKGKEKGQIASTIPNQKKKWKEKRKKLHAVGNLTPCPSDWPQKKGKG